jgi:dihydroneopterin aldolase
LGYGKGRSWKLIETLAVDLAAMILAEFKPERVAVEVKKFVLPEARWVSVRVRRVKG